MKDDINSDWAGAHDELPTHSSIEDAYIDEIHMHHIESLFKKERLNNNLDELSAKRFENAMIPLWANGGGVV